MSADTVAPVETTKAIFRKLRSLPENKVCFDCCTKNPSWCTIPYGAYVCLECSGVHRSLGTHLTFIRSSDLDGAWTWKQLRCMQVGGNAKARAFFRANGGETSDKNKKYSSRAATLYKAKIEKLALEAVRKYAGETHIGAVASADDSAPAKNRHDDFFSKFDNADLKQEAPVPAQVKQEAIIVTPVEPEKTLAEVSNGMDKLSVNLETKPAKPVKVAKLGAKKTGKKSAFGGAKKVDKTAFKAASSAAERVEKEEKVVQKMDSGEATLSTEAAARLTYKQIERDQKKASANLSGKKAESAARLGMGFGGMRTVTHDTDFQEIRQVEASTTFKEPSILDEESMGSFSRRKEENDDLADLYAARKGENMYQRFAY
ncbi:Oidioi.mRNA.OKI2018_I69.PAR.g13056.t2.cds [Oikopleura dioica]|uniref:Oidioi.mRNA.OKI2018_I69.PAR.g13056.t2.cds n=1 Tax=Oikopleura dioica TaxID=34765 RepID=A0ABN7S2X4_OIKDI|nr:Oidioi.mRNA.OKI2018_I69.PAR.g13056.t2.cds [Oikopleura dioica]